jgi:hypothetical protein
VSDRQDIDHILKRWPFDPLSVNVRVLKLRNRRVLQMRVDMGVLQLEMEGRPDGGRFDGAKTYFELLQRKAKNQRSKFVLSEEECVEVDREFVQFYHRRVCWLQLKDFPRAVRDADHTLGLMDFCKQHSPDEQWTISHEQYRPFVLYHRTQAAALAKLEANGDNAAEQAIEEVNVGLAKLKSVFVDYDAEDQFEEDELVQRLIEFRDGLRSKYEINRTLSEQLQDAIEAEDYERAAEIRDKLSSRTNEVDFGEA